MLTISFILPEQNFAGEQQKLGSRIGLLNNVILDRTDFQTGYTGIGLGVELIWQTTYSIHGQFNTLRISTCASGKLKTNEDALNTTEAALAFRARLNDSMLRFFPEAGVGFWGAYAGNYFMGIGTEYEIAGNFNITGTIDYLILDSNLFVKNSFDHWTSSMWRISLIIQYRLF